MKKAKNSIKPFEHYIISQFRFAYYENAQRVAMAFAQANHPVTVGREDDLYNVVIYSNRPQPQTK